MGDIPAPREVQLLEENNLQIENEDFLASVRVRVCGGTHFGNFVVGAWQAPDKAWPIPTYFEIEYCEFTGNINALATEALLANLSYDFG